MFVHEVDDVWNCLNLWLGYAQRGCFAESEIMHIHLQLVLALSHIHKVKILHRDLMLGKKKNHNRVPVLQQSSLLCFFVGFGCFVVESHGFYP